MDQQALKKTHSRSDHQGSLIIPVVVHVFHLGEKEGSGANISDNQILSAIQSLNEAFSGGAEYTTKRTGITFQLAERTPDCKPTRGIVRINASQVCYAGDCYRTKGITAKNEIFLKGQSRWSAQEYLNVWVVSEIENNNGSSGIQGFATFPGTAAEEDGVVILSNAFGYDPLGVQKFNLKSGTRMNNIFIHEVGHALGLYHSFEGDDVDRDGRSDRCPYFNACGLYRGDCVSDTPPHRRSNNDCNTKDNNVCDGGHPNELYIHNFMDYSNQMCQTEFTVDQTNRMWSVIQTGRSGWMHSSGHLAIDVYEPAQTKCSPQTKNLSNKYGLGIQLFQIGEFISSTGTAVEDGGYLNHWCEAIHVERNRTYAIRVFTGDQNIQNVKVFVDFNGDGDFTDRGEMVFQSSYAKDHHGIIRIPSTARQNLPLRIRAIASYAGFQIGDACFTPWFGQVEDYSLVIGELEMASADPDLLYGLESTSEDISMDDSAWNAFEIPENAFELFPNPVSGTNLIVDQDPDWWIPYSKVQIINLTGEMLIEKFTSERRTELNLSSISPGLYYARIWTDRGIVSKKFLKQ